MNDIRIQTVPETGSTNDDVKALARDGEEEGFWLRSERQTLGRGRQGRAWDSPDTGNLYTSTLVRLRDGDPPAATLAFLASLALYQAAAYALRLRGSEGSPEKLTLKWPNDVLLDGKKLSGILLEREGDTAIIGIGVNLASHPTAVDRPATSLAEYGDPPTPDIFLSDLAGRFQALLHGWRLHGVAPLLANWLRHAHALGAPLAVHDGEGERVEGQFAGLDEDGALRLRLADGSERVIHAGDVFLI